MEAKNYKLIDNRPELLSEEILKGMDFESALKRSVSVKGSFSGKSLFLSIGFAVLGILAIIIFNIKTKETKTDLVKPLINETITNIPVQTSSRGNEEPVIKKTNSMQPKSKSDSTEQLLVTKELIEVKEEYSNEEFTKPRSLPFKVRGNADAESAIIIKDSIYGPANVSVGKGDYLEYNDPNNRKSLEKNSAWFKFTVKKDTMLTFHIVPTLKTDDYDFALFKCDNYTCLREIKMGKLKPVRYCFSYNTTMNINTGLSNRARDTTFRAWSHLDGQKDHGKTYAQGLRVKAGETYYLMINISGIEYQNRDPEGFMIYFYNYLPLGRANTYIYPNK